MTETIYFPEYVKPTLGDDFKQRVLDNWTRSCTRVDGVKFEIKYFRHLRKRDMNQLKALQAKLAEHCPGFDELAEHRVSRLADAIEYWDEYIAFLKWLLKQPSSL